MYAFFIDFRNGHGGKEGGREGRREGGTEKGRDGEREGGKALTSKLTHPKIQIWTISFISLEFIYTYI